MESRRIPAFVLLAFLETCEFMSLDSYEVLDLMSRCVLIAFFVNTYVIFDRLNLSFLLNYK